MGETVSPRQILLSLTLLTATILAGLPSTGNAQTIFFTENFDNANFGARGWFDGTSGTIDTSVYSPAGGNSSLKLSWPQGSTTPPAPKRHLFTASETVYISYWQKLGTSTVAWQGSGKPYHPHFIILLTDADNDYVGPNASRLEVGVEMSLFTPRLFAADGIEINTTKLGVDLLSSAEPHAIGGGNGSQNASSGYYPDPSPPNYNNQTYWDSASANFINNTWQHIEVYAAMNSTTGGIPNRDGILKYWVDGNLVVNYSNVYLRTGNNPTRKFNKFLLVPYIGDGSPIAQDMWIDNLTVADQRGASPTIPAPTNLRVIP